MNNEMEWLHSQIRANIDQYGRQCLGVLPDGDTVPLAFIYTIGNTVAARPMPELLLIGDASPMVMGVLNHMSQMMQERGTPFEHGEVVDLGGMQPVMVLQAGHKARSGYTIQAGQYLGREDYPVLQVVMPDTEGHWPHDPACQPPYNQCPILTEAN
jgi:hypothetical protein